MVPSAEAKAIVDTLRRRAYASPIHEREWEVYPVLSVLDSFVLVEGVLKVDGVSNRVC